MNVQIAGQQPPTTGKVILYTSHGEIQIQLWTKQAPLACRNFIQLCLQNYYTNTIFHRLIPGFMIQGGDPSGTGMGGQSIYGQKFKDQFHQRLKFTKRGMVAMANAGKNTNGSQFFITFGACQHLNKIHTIFGKIVGDTIYNVMALQSLDTGQNDRPNDPPIIRKTKVVINPFTDIKPRNKVQNQQLTVQKLKQLQQAKRIKQQTQNIKKKQQLKKLKKKNKLTFDLQQDQQQQNGQNNKIKSSHDVLYKKDKTLSNQVSITKEQLQKRRKQKQLEDKKTLQLKKILQSKKIQENQHQNQQQQNVNTILTKQMNRKRAGYQRNLQGIIKKQDQQILDYQKRYNPNTKKYQIIFKDQLQRQRIQKQRQQQAQRKAKQHQLIQDQKLRKVRQMQLQQYNLLKADELNFKKAKQGSLKQRRKQIIDEQKKLLSNLQRHRYEYLKKQQIQKHQGQLFKKLIDFSSRLKKTPNNENQKQKAWMNHSLKFHIDSTNAYSLQQKKNLVNHQDDGGLKIQEQINNQEDYYMNQDDIVDKLYNEVNQKKEQ